MDGSLYDGAAVRRLRQTAGIRMVDLARAADCSYRHLQQFEKGPRHISPEMAYRLANALTSLTGRTVEVEDFCRPFRQDAA